MQINDAASHPDAGIHNAAQGTQPANAALDID